MTRTRTSLLFALLLAPAVLEAQHATRDSTFATHISRQVDSIARNPRLNARSQRALARLRADSAALVANAGTAYRVDTLLRTTTDTLIVTRTDTLRLVRVDTVLVAVKDSTVTPPPPVDTTTKPDTTTPPVIVTPGAPPGTIWTHPLAPPSNGALLAELPRDTVDVSYPAITRRYLCTNLQACLDTAKSGDEIRLAPGYVASNPRVRPTARAGWLVVRADVTDVQLGGQWDRMTPAKASSLNLPRITSSTTDEPLQFLSGSHHVRLVGVVVGTTSPMTNALIRIGMGESDPAQLPHDIVLDRVVADPGTNDVRRCIAFEGYRLAVISSTLANCHSRAGDSQGILSINGRGLFRIENNTIQGGHQSIMFGGGDPAIRGQVPSDAVIRRNDLRRPYAWRGTWPAKTNFELKIGKRILVEGNLIGGTYADGQVGYTVLLKTENQDGGTWGDWSETSDVTVRYNLLNGAAGGFNLSGLPQGPGIPMSRVSIYGNVADSIGVGNYYAAGVGDALQVGAVADLVYTTNWTRNPAGRSCVYSMGTNARFVLTNNVCGGQYALKVDAGGALTQSVMTNGLLSGMTLLPWGTSFGAWPAAPVDSTRDALLRGVQ